MKPLRTIRRLACIVAGLATAGLALGTASPAAFAYRLPPQGGPGTPAHAPAQVHTIVTGGTSGWQIVLIAIAAAVLAAVPALVLDRAWAARHLAAPTG